MTQMADKDRPYSPLRLLLPTPITVSNFQSSTRTEEVELPGGEGKEGREEGGAREGQQSLGSSGSLGKEQTGFKSNLQAAGCWRGWGWVRERGCRHWDNQ